MLDVRPVAYIAPVAEQPIGPITPIIRIASVGDEASTLTGLVRIYRKTTDQLLFTSELPVTYLPGHTTVDVAALTPWDPPAPADDDYFILCDTIAVNPLVPDGYCGHLGAYTFDVKTVPMGPVPAGHHTTHEFGGMDEIDITGLSGLLADAQVPTAHDQSASTITSGTATGPIAVTGSYNSTLKVDTVVANAVTVNWAEGNVHRVVLPSGATTVTLSNPTSGIRGCIVFVQPPSGAAGTVVFSPTVKTAGGLGITLSSANNAVDDVYFLYDGTGMAYHAMAALAWA